MNERIKKLRKRLDLTQQEFADRIGVKRNTIANYEIGRNEPIDSVLALIVREFHVNEDWLRHGTGGDDAMFASTPKSKLDAMAEAHGLTDEQYILLQKFISLKPEIRQGILDYVMDIAAAVGPQIVASPSSTSQEPTDREALHAELDRQLNEEKGVEERSVV